MWKTPSQLQAQLRLDNHLSIAEYFFDLKPGLIDAIMNILPIRVLVLSAIAFIYTFIIGVILTNSLYPIMLKNGIVQNVFRPVENNLLVDPPKGSPSMEYIQSCIANIDTVTANPLFATGKQHHSPDSAKLLTSGNVTLFQNTVKG